MLLECIDAIGMAEMESALSDVDIKNTILMVIDRDNFSCVNIDSKSDVSNSDDVIYAKERIFYSDYIVSNKSVCIGGKFKTPKMVTTANKYALSFNIETFRLKVEDTNSFAFNNPTLLLETIIEDYYLGLEAYTENPIDEKHLVLKYKDEILNILETELTSKKKLRIFIRASVEDYAKEYDGYFSKKIFDEEVEEGVGFFSSFVTINPKKPLLRQYSGLTELPQVYDYKTAVMLYKLKFYMDKKFGIFNTLSKGEYDVKLSVEYNPMDKCIVGFDINPYIYVNDKEVLELEISSVISSHANEYSITTYNGLLTLLNRLSGFAMSSENKSDSDKRKFYHLFKDAIVNIYEAEDGSKVCVADNEFVRVNIMRIMDAVISINNITKTSNKDGYFRMANLINLKLGLRDYFEKGRGIMVEDVKAIKKSFAGKMLMYKEVKSFDSMEETLFAAGQLAFYVNSKTRGKLLSTSIVKYAGVKNSDRLLQMLAIDIKKYDHDINMYGRELKIYALIQEMFMGNNVPRFDKHQMSWFEIGLYGDNYFFIKKEDLAKEIEE